SYCPTARYGGFGVDRLRTRWDDRRQTFRHSGGCAAHRNRHGPEALARRSSVKDMIRPEIEPRSARETPLPNELRAGKNTAIYNVHSYSTKVPFQAIVPFIAGFTKVGERVLDPFCGSGMTGVAASLLGRRARLSDISPAAVHIASNYVTPCDARA